jgi:hypothetical protein
VAEGHRRPLRGEKRRNLNFQESVLRNGFTFEEVDSALDDLVHWCLRRGQELHRSPSHRRLEAPVVDEVVVA